MDSKDFTYWLKGFFELSESNSLTETQVQIIKEHLDLVFNKKTSTKIEPNVTFDDINDLDKFKKQLEKCEVSHWEIHDRKLCSGIEDPNIPADTPTWAYINPGEKVSDGDIDSPPGASNIFKKVKLATDMPPAKKLTKKELEEAREDARKIRKMLDEKTNGMESLIK